jgi:hypothetical protein
VNAPKTKAALTAFVVLIFFHLVIHFAFSNESKAFNPAAFSAEAVLLVIMGCMLFAITKDKKE